MGAHLEMTWVVTIEEMLLAAARQKSGLLGTLPPMGWPPGTLHTAEKQADAKSRQKSGRQVKKCQTLSLS